MIWAILVGRPHRAAFLATEAERATDQPGHRPLEAHGHFREFLPELRHLRSIMLLLTSVLPTAASAGQEIVDGDGEVFISPPKGVTIPRRSESAPLARATWYASFSLTRLAIAYELEQSIRILPS
jgi:hypothetical protein